MFHDDFLLRTIRQLVEALAAALRGRREDQDEADHRVEGFAGLSLDVAATLPTPMLLGLLTTSDGLAADRALVLALGLAARSRGPGAQAGLADKARALGAAALAARPDLAVQGVCELLDLPRPTGGV